MKKYFTFIATGILLSAVALPVLAATTDYGASVVSVAQGLTKGGSPVSPARSDPNQALGAPDGSFFSLGFGGTVTISFANYVGTNLSIAAHEITYGSYPFETASVEISQDGSSWTSIGTADNQSGVGPNPHTTNFNLSDGTCIKYVRITDTTDPAPFTAAADGFDLDAVSATYDATCVPSPDGKIKVSNSNEATVINEVVTSSSTGGNTSDGGSATNILRKSGNVAGDDNDNNATSAGSNNATGGNGGSVTTGDAVASSVVTTSANVNRTLIGSDCSCSGLTKVKNQNSAYVGNFVGTAAGTGLNAASAGNSGNSVKKSGNVVGSDNDHNTTSAGGNTSNGGTGGSVTTGAALSASSVMNVVNRNITRISLW